MLALRVPDMITPSLASPLLVSEWGTTFIIVELGGVVVGWPSWLRHLTTYSLPPLSWDTGQAGWLAGLATAGYTVGDTFSPQASLRLLRGPTGSSGNHQTYNVAILASPVQTVRIILHIILELTFRSKYFLICSFLCSINKAKPLQRSLFLGFLHNKRQDSGVYTTEIAVQLGVSEQIKCNDHQSEKMSTLRHWAIRIAI